MFKKFTKKSLSIILCVTVLLSCMVFAMPAANAAGSNYYYRVYIQTPDQYEMTHDAKDIKVYYKDHNGTDSSTDTYTTFSLSKDQLNDDYAEWYMPSESGAVLTGFPWKVGFGELQNNNFALNAHIHVELQVSKNGSDWHWVAGNKAGDSSDFQKMTRKSNMSDISVASSDYPKTTYPSSVTTTPSGKVTLNGTSTVNVAINAPTLYDQYGVVMERTISYSSPVYNPSAFSLSGTTLKITKNAHIDEEGTNQQSFNIKVQWSGSDMFTTRLTVEDEKYTAVYNWYESNETNPASPTLKTKSIEGIYYGDFPTDEQIPEAVDNYYTDTQHFTDGIFPTIPTNNTYTMLYTAANHSMLTKVEDEPTCQGPGTTKHYCNCGYSYIEAGTPAQVDHDYVTQVVEPTCTEQGYTLHTCRFCGDTYKDSYVDELGHNYKRISITAATCTEAGSYTYECRRCGDINVEVIPAKGHDFVSKVIAPTCTQGGYTEYVCKNRCGTSYTDNPTEALGHDHQLVEDTPATCTTAGKKVYKCSRCDDSYDVTSEALGHDFATSAITTPATCTEAGVKTYYCSRCDEVQTEPISPTGHNYEKTTVPPDCENQGYDLYKCSKCQDEYKENYTDALGHIWNEGVVTTEAKCTEDGVKTFTCSRCHNTKQEPIEKLGHSYNSEIINPTCTEQGYTLFTCIRCEDNYKDNFVEALGHNFSTNKITTEPTCTEDGVRTYYCSRCDATENEPVEKLGHNYIPNVVAPTCTEQGYTEYKCSRCEDTYKDNFVDDLGGHLFTDYFYNEDATCTHDGTETATCDRCDATDTRTAEGTKLEHQFGEWQVNIEPKCEAAGENIRYCANCDAFETEPVKALGHNFGEWQVNTEPKCEEAGENIRYCSRCDAFETEPVKALGHNFGEWQLKTEPKCEEEGENIRYCSRCDAFETEPVKALGHNFGEWQLKTAPKCEEEGENIRYCTRCEAFETEPVKALGHDYIVNTVEATCLEGAYTETTCSRCDYYAKQTISEPIAHTWTQVVENPENETNGYVYYKCEVCEKYANAVLSDDNTAKVGTEIFESADLVKAETLEISAPSFNKYYSTEQEYDYSTRGAALKYSDPTYIDDFTTQDTRFTASLFIPSNVDVSFSGESDNKVTDFGFVFAQTEYIDSANELKLGNNTYSISVPERNEGAGNISNWNGVSVHDDSFGGSTLTFNLLLKVRAINWSKDYCARAYVTYSQNGFTYTVYDSSYASRSVADIARAVVASDTETQEAKEYCQTKILDNLNVY